MRPQREQGALKRGQGLFQGGEKNSMGTVKSGWVMSTSEWKTRSRED